MSQALFPTTLFPTFPFDRKPIFNTVTQRAVSGRELRLSYQSYPLYQYSLNYEFLRDNATFPEADTLIGFYLSRQGSFDSFLFDDPTDDNVTDMQFGVGDGVTTGFQLTRSFGAGGNTFAEPVQNVKAITNIKKAGAATGAYTIDGNGFVTFNPPIPVNGAVLTWTGSYYMRCRFVDDTIDMSQIYNGIWELKKLQFVGAPGNRV